MSQGPQALRSSRDDSPSIDDATLVARLAAGDDAALAPLVARHGARVANFLGHVLDDRSWRDDLVQEVFVRLCLRAADYDARWPLPVWLLRIARNLAIDWMRREAARRRAHGAFGLGRRGDLEVPADHGAMQDELGAALAEALQALPEAFRTVFVLKEIEHLHYDEIAAVMGVGEKTISTRLHRARARLRARLADWLEP